MSMTIKLARTAQRDVWFPHYRYDSVEHLSHDALPLIKLMCMAQTENVALDNWLAYIDYVWTPHNLFISCLLILGLSSPSPILSAVFQLFLQHCMPVLAKILFSVWLPPTTQLPPYYRLTTTSFLDFTWNGDGAQSHPGMCRNTEVRCTGSLRTHRQKIACSTCTGRSNVFIGKPYNRVNKYIFESKHKCYIHLLFCVFFHKC